MEPRVKPDRFMEAQQCELLWVKLERMKTRERDVRTQERPIKSKIRMEMSSAK